jgi:hypothetical protein
MPIFFTINDRTVFFTINDKTVEVGAHLSMPLLWVLRHHLRITRHEVRLRRCPLRRANRRGRLRRY